MVTLELLARTRVSSATSSVVQLMRSPLWEFSFRDDGNVNVGLVNIGMVAMNSCNIKCLDGSSGILVTCSVDDLDELERGTQ